jgi:hypothetical protein
MSDVLTFTTATGRLALGRSELVALAEEVAADRVRGLDGLGLLHVGVDTHTALAALERRGLDRSRADLLGSEAAWVRQRLALLRLDRPGERAVMVLRHEADRLDARLLAEGGDLACVVSTRSDEPVDFVIEDVEPGDTAERAWRWTGLPPAAGDIAPAGWARLPHPLALGLRDAASASADDAAARLVDAGLAPEDASGLVDDVTAGALPLVRVVAWRRRDDSDDRVTESTLSWMVGRDRLWLIDDRSDAAWAEIAPASESQAGRELAEVLA